MTADPTTPRTDADAAPPAGENEDEDPVDPGDPHIFVEVGKRLIRLPRCRLADDIAAGYRAKLVRELDNT